MTNKDKIKQSQDYWDIQKSGKRLLWRLSPNKKGEYNSFKPDIEDFNALKSVLGAINRFEKETLKNSDLFVKLFLMEMVGKIREEGTTVFNDYIFNELSHQLSKPVELFYMAFYHDLCSNQFNRLTKGQITDKEGNEIVMDANRFKETFTLEYVSDKINEQIINILHRRS